MKLTKLVSSVALVLMIFSACGGGDTEVVESGTYSGTIDRVNADEVEIYVNLDSGERIELYFTDETTLTSGGEEVPFSILEAEDRVEVIVERVGQRLDPISVTLLE